MIFEAMPYSLSYLLVDKIYIPSRTIIIDLSIALVNLVMYNFIGFPLIHLKFVNRVLIFSFIIHAWFMLLCELVVAILCLMQ